METKRGLTPPWCQQITGLMIGQIGRITTNRMTEMPEVNTDLIGATCQGPRFQQRSAIVPALDQAELRPGRQTVDFINRARA